MERATHGLVRLNLDRVCVLYIILRKVAHLPWISGGTNLRRTVYCSHDGGYRQQFSLRNPRSRFEGPRASVQNSILSEA